VAEERVEKSVPLRSGTVIPQATSYYGITALGIDKIEGPSEYTMKKFQGINIPKEQPNKEVVSSLWNSIKEVATALGLVADVASLAGPLGPFLL
jgi:hypothetical protein